MLYCMLLSAMALGLPFGLAVFPIHAYRHWAAARAARAGGPAARAELVAPLQDAVEDACQLDRGVLRVRGTGTALPLHQGRPDWGALLQEAAEDSGCACVGVYSCGALC